ncbi:helix-hairpin-helix domain-containing protein [Terriglobus roseus]|uniref:Competence protein ComEA n=1 Tax=Terriglobus roseus TaxID=392734 RepID=A0A1G7KN27_9BACT|nr:helix-hairpin-helix domain-containing protein [Terriglobus roseus]SDF38531.1 competence protein ComEA [Terriglobus roseus]
MTNHTARVVRRCAYLGFVFFLTGAHAQQMADGPDKDLFVKTCSKCHEIERVLSKRQDKSGWQDTVTKMQGYGLVADDSDLKRIIDYLAVNLPAETMLKLNINTATRIDFESTLSVKRSVAIAIIEYRDKNGGFKSVEELKKVPGVDADVVDAKKNGLTL